MYSFVVADSLTTRYSVVLFLYVNLWTTKFFVFVVLFITKLLFD